jgi:hypothetical protein
MKQYKVIALSVGGRANKIFSAGDTVNEDNFIPGRADELEKQGFLQLTGSDDLEVKPLSSDEVETEVIISEKPEEENKDSEESTEEETTSLLDNIQNSLGDTEEVKPKETEKQDVKIDQISKKQIIKTLTDLGIPFEPTANKTELYALWLSRDNY